MTGEAEFADDQCAWSAGSGRRRIVNDDADSLLAGEAEFAYNSCAGSSVGHGRRRIVNDDAESPFACAAEFADDGFTLAVDGCDAHDRHHEFHQETSICH